MKKDSKSIKPQSAQSKKQYADKAGSKQKAENQRKRRAAKKKFGPAWLKGKDYDHKTKRFTSIKKNRGNRGKGTKKEK